MDGIDRQIINQWQGGFPICERPYAVVAETLGIEESDLLRRLQRLRDEGDLSRFGPMYNIERMGGAFCLAAMKIPETVFDEIAEQVNRFPEVAHNYRREHEFNMWFVLATERQDEIEQTAVQIENVTGFKVFLFPKLDEFFVELKLMA